MIMRIKMDYGLNCLLVILLANSETCKVKCLFDFNFLNLFCVCILCATTHVWKAEITFRNQFCPSIMSFQGIKLGCLYLLSHRTSPK